MRWIDTKNKKAKCAKCIVKPFSDFYINEFGMPRSYCKKCQIKMVVANKKAKELIQHKLPL